MCIRDRNPTEQDFEKLKKLFFKSFQQLHSDEQLIVISYLLNYTSAEMKKGNSYAYTQAFELFKFGIKHQIFIGEDGYLSPTKFTNIVVVGCRIKKFDWVENFIKKSTSYLNPKHNENTVLVAQACLRFEEKKFKQVIAISSTILFKDDYFSLRTRAMVLCSYYELYHKNNQQLIQDYCKAYACLLYTSPSPRDATLSRMPSSA